MSWNTGNIAASSTPATDLYNTVTGFMTSWTFVESVPAATAGTTADCKVWRAPGNDWFLIFEPDDTNSVLRIRASKEYDTATHKVRRYVPGFIVTTTATPKADYSYDDTLQTIATAGWARVLVSATGFTYWVGVGQGNGSAQDLIYITTSVTSGGSPSGAMAGFFTPTNTNDFPLFLWSEASSTANNQWSNVHHSLRTSHEYGYSTAVNFAGGLGFPLGNVGSSFFPWGQLYSSNRNPYITDGIYVFDALVCMNNNSASAAVMRAGYRGYLPGFKVAHSGAVTIGDTVTVGSTTYFVGGAGSGGSAFGNTTNSTLALLINTAAAF
jgi:hypothetical protein